MSVALSFFRKEVSALVGNFAAFLRLDSEVTSHVLRDPMEEK